jgi:hypothetical protein
MVVRRTDYGVGVVQLNGFGIWALWVRGDNGIWKVRISLDDFAPIGVHEYQRVRLKIPREDEQWLYFRGRRRIPRSSGLSSGRMCGGGRADCRAHLSLLMLHWILHCGRPLANRSLPACVIRVSRRFSDLSDFIFNNSSMPASLTRV